MAAISGSSPIDRTLPVSTCLGNTHSTLKTIKRLDRLAGLNSILPQSSRTRLLGRLGEIWKPEVDESLEGSLKRIRTTLNRLGVLKNLEPTLDSIKSEKDLTKCAKRFEKDTYSLITAPLKRSAAGIRGPTFLVSFPRHTKVGAFNEAYVLKWADWNESLSNELYENISNGFSSTIPYTFMVPKASTFDLEGKIHAMSNGERHDLESEIYEEFEKTLNHIVKTQDAELEPETRQVMLMERVNGENLLDFAQSKYHKLSPHQKEKLFTRLGRIALLDTVMGNLDRLVQIFDDQDGNYAFRSMESNLGNIMLSWNPDEPESMPNIYAIDNGIYLPLLTDESARKKYCEFLETQLQSLELAETMTSNIIESMQSAINTQIEDSDQEDMKSAREDLATFSQELKTIATDALKKGVVEMIRHLKQHTLPKWESDLAAPLKERMLSCPGLLESTTERLAIFKST